MTDPKEHWETDIADWEAHQYDDKISLKSIVHWLTRNSNQALQLRKQFPLDHLATHISGKRVVEIGCGTAPLSQKLIKLGARTYHGYDIAENAIRIARERTRSNDKITFECLDILDIPPLETDFVISIGVTHWITNDRVNHMLKIGKSADFLHHFSERRINLKQILRYLHLRSIGAPEHQRWYPMLDEVKELIKENGYKDIYTFNHSKLGCITFFSTLPFPDNIIT